MDMQNFDRSTTLTVRHSEKQVESALKLIKKFKGPTKPCQEILTHSFFNSWLSSQDNSTAMVLREVARLNSARNVKVHTISFNCDDRFVAFLFILFIFSLYGILTCFPE